MRISSSSDRRAAMTLLEVLIAMAIALFSLATISQIFDSASNRALDIQMRSRATRLAQSKLAEFSSGVLSVQSGGAGSGSFDEEPEWSWSANIQQQGTAQNLYSVTITVSRGQSKAFDTSITQYLLDPKMKGTIAAPSSSSSNSSSSSSNSGQQSNSNSQPANSGASAPASGGGAASAGGAAASGSTGGNAAGGKTGGTAAGGNAAGGKTGGTAAGGAGGGAAK